MENNCNSFLRKLLAPILNRLWWLVLGQNSSPSIYFLTPIDVPCMSMER